jgi:hypothetical protein
LVILVTSFPSRSSTFYTPDRRLGCTAKLFGNFPGIGVACRMSPPACTPSGCWFPKEAHPPSSQRQDSCVAAGVSNTREAPAATLARRARFSLCDLFRSYCGSEPSGRRCRPRASTSSIADRVRSCGRAPGSPAGSGWLPARASSARAASRRQAMPACCRHAANGPVISDKCSAMKWRACYR